MLETSINCLRNGGSTFYKLQFCVVRSMHERSRVPRVRFDRRDRPHAVAYYGYHSNFYEQGQRLPRLKNSMQQVKGKCNSRDVILAKRQDVFRDKKAALMGTNDYIDLLGNGRVHPAQLLYHVPRWLRGFPGEQRAGELQKLIHYRNMYKEKMQRSSPTQWHALLHRINRLMTYVNYTKQDELRDERVKGLWDEEADYHFVDLEKRSYTYDV